MPPGTRWPTPRHRRRPADVSWKVTRATVETRTATALTAELALEGTTALARLQLRFDTPATLDVI